MLNFFRKIRRNLSDEGNLKKYLLYSIGEVFLVVIGILIALQINNRNEWRKDREREVAVLEDIAENLEFNIQVLENELARIETLNRSGDMVFEALRSKQNNEDLTPRDWQRSLYSGGNLSLSLSGYESLKNSGFDLLLNRSVKKEVVSLYETIFTGVDRSKGIIDNFIPSNDKFVLEHFVMNTDEQGRLVGGIIPRNFDHIVNDHYFFGLIEITRRHRLMFFARYDSALKEIQRVHQLIEDELNESN